MQNILSRFFSKGKSKPIKFFKTKKIQRKRNKALEYESNMSSGSGANIFNDEFYLSEKIISKTLNKDIKMFKIISYNKQGTLTKILHKISQYNFDFTNCESSFINNDIRHFELHLFIREHANEVVLNEEFMRKLLKGLALDIKEIEAFNLPEFPTKLEDLNSMEIQLQDLKDELNEDHPGKNDPIYLKRRVEIGDFCKNYKMLDNIPRVNYNSEEKELWKSIYEKLTPMIFENGEKSFVENFKCLERDFLFQPDEIPQLDEINKYLISKSNWRIKPVNGILSQRAYLNSLAFRTFCSTQYLRHHSKPFYTPEPDIFHEFFGHIPMFLNPKFCDISQKLGIYILNIKEFSL